MDRNSATGQFVETYPPEAFMNALCELNGAAGTTDIASDVGCTRDAAYKRLTSMREDGWIESQQVGGSLLWILAVDETEDIP